MSIEEEIVIDLKRLIVEAEETGGDSRSRRIVQGIDKKIIQWLKLSKQADSSFAFSK